MRRLAGGGLTLLRRRLAIRRLLQSFPFFRELRVRRIHRGLSLRCHLRPGQRLLRGGDLLLRSLRDRVGKLLHLRQRHAVVHARDGGEHDRLLCSIVLNRQSERRARDRALSQRSA